MRYLFWGVELNTVRTGNWTNHPMSERYYKAALEARTDMVYFDEASRIDWGALAKHILGDNTIEEKPKMLDLTKKYRTRDGREVTDLRNEFPRSTRIEGFISGGTGLRTWHGDGRHLLHSPDLDLVPACEHINLSKKYQTAKGEAVEIFVIRDGRAWGRYDLGPSIYQPNNWRSNSWDVNDHTLQEVRKTHTRDFVVAHYRDRAPIVNHGNLSPLYHHGDTIGITKHSVTFEEGEGLTASSTSGKAG